MPKPTDDMKPGPKSFGAGGDDGRVVETTTCPGCGTPTELTEMARLALTAANKALAARGDRPLEAKDVSPCDACRKKWEAARRAHAERVQRKDIEKREAVEERQRKASGADL